MKPWERQWGAAPQSAPAQAAPAGGQGGNGWNDPAHLARVYDWQRRAGLSTEAAITYRRMLDLQGGTTQPTFSMTPQFATDANGNPVMLQLGNDGSIRQPALPDGVSLSRQPIEVDGGTHTILIDPITRQEITRIDKNVRTTAAEEAGGTVEGRVEAERAASAPADAQNATNALHVLKQIREHPGMGWGTGFSSYGNWIRGSSGYDFQNLVNQAKGGAFLQAIEQMKGLGALSNMEGEAATAAIARMDTATSEEAFRAALDDYERIINQALERAQSRMPGGQAAPVTAPAEAQPGGMMAPPVEAAPAAAPAMGGMLAPVAEPPAPVAGTQDNPHQPSSKEQFQAIRPGEWFVYRDGSVRQK